MPDPIWLDNNILDRAIKGDVDIRNKLAAYRSQGRPLLITPWVRGELLHGGKKIGKGMTPDRIVQAEAVMKSLGIELDSSGAKVGFQKFKEYYNTKPTGGGISNTDRMVLTEIKACAEARGVKAPELMTAEIGKKAMAANTKAWGVTPVVHAEPFKPPPPAAPVKPPGGSGTGGSGASGAPSGGTGGAPAGGSSGGTGTSGAKPTTTPAKGAPTATGTSVDSVKADQAKSRNVAPKAPNIRIEDYPPERRGPVTRFFEDKPVLKQAGLLAAGATASEIKGKMLEKVTAHFIEAASKGTSEFRSGFPNVGVLMQAADLDRLHKEATQALVGVVAASGAQPDLRPFGRDRVAATRALVAWLRKRGDKPAATRAYDKAAQAYVDALSDLTTKIARLREPMQAMADDIGKRASVLLNAGRELEELFWRFVPLAAAHPIAYYEWFDVKAVADTFLSVGGAVDGLRVEIVARMAEYDSMLSRLYEELQATSELMARFAPDGG